MLIGEYTHTIDDKHRVSLPAKFRKEMGKTLVVTPGLDACLFVFTEKQWSHIAGILGEASMLQSDNRSFNRFMFGSATEVVVDSAGRVLIPEALTKRIGIDQKLVFVGVGSRVEIWNEATWHAYKQEVSRGADALAEKLGAVGIL